MPNPCWNLFTMLLFLQLTKLAEIGWLWVFCPFPIFFVLGVIGKTIENFVESDNR